MVPHQEDLAGHRPRRHHRGDRPHGPDSLPWLQMSLILQPGLLTANGWKDWKHNNTPACFRYAQSSMQHCSFTWRCILLDVVAVSVFSSRFDAPSQ
ncbi:hypothetical protein SORBI_3001G305350 [Sorghum bicolor]|uniref:Uncharacterized protein n=1 Tax=Sorghum bicolor TaxID=4558 RepID=A0A1Z5S8M4_SORBI|nr:hypothetical protein SORBI_3001G305350 [Sorghum bicolor]OQU92177.1 hypothetical protein SORBI_3001G305350 [Sorghum bicolor]OQU92178.1 hypothetical protein SORBI_3001G305350 [Sorghum bicolor]OQU92179.1 hypothetical protein SORBI_3001G305350 [Sorghum bicolor]